MAPQFQWNDFTKIATNDVHWCLILTPVADISVALELISKLDEKTKDIENVPDRNRLFKISFGSINSTLC